MNISAIIVKVLPLHLNEVVQKLKDTNLCDYHFNDEKGQIVVTIEGKSVSQELSKIEQLQKMQYVISADMQMAYSEDELDEHMEVIKNSDIVPKMLLDDTIDPNDIIYRGNLVKKNLHQFSEDFDNKDK